MDILYKLDKDLVPFTDIVVDALTDSPLSDFTVIGTRDLFTDGFQFPLGCYSTPKELYTFLQNQGLDVMMPYPSQNPEFLFVKLAANYQYLPGVL